MKKLSTILLGSLFTVAALANNLNLSTAVGELSTQAGKVQKSAEEMSLQLKKKPVNVEQVTRQMDAVHADINKLKALAAEIEASNPNLTPSQKQNWDLVKTKIQLLEVFASNKKDLLAKGDPNKHRSYLKAHSDGIAIRAQLLQQTAGKI